MLMPRKSKLRLRPLSKRGEVLRKLSTGDFIMETTNKVVEYAHVLIKLLQDVLYDEDNAAWSDLLTIHITVRDYFAKIGLELHIDEREGFAFLKQRDDEDSKLPRLVRRAPISYDV